MSFTIKELETLSGIRAHTIRMWEQRYGFLKPSRTATNIRTYSNEELKTLLTVALLNRHGYKISRIDNMAPADRERRVLELPHADVRVERVLNQLIGAMVDFKPIELESLLDHEIRVWGLIAALDQVILPFLEKVGILWQTSRILPVQEHLVSALVRQKIVAAVDALPHASAEGPVHALFLPEREFHELGLLIVQYLMRSKGVPVVYLSASLPVEDLLQLIRNSRVDALYIHLTVGSFSPALERYFNQMIQLLPFDLPIIISGHINDYVSPAIRSRIHYLHSLEAVKEYIQRL